MFLDSDSLENICYGVLGESIISSYKPLRVHDGLIICGDRVVYAGDRNRVEELASILNAPIIMYKKKHILPGFIDSHIHIDSYALKNTILDLTNTTSLKEIVSRLREFIKENKELEWIIGRGWDQDKLVEKTPPTKELLDNITREKPVVLIRVCGHAATLNTIALEKLGNIVDLGNYREYIDLDKGIIYEELVDKLLDNIPVDKKKLKKLYTKAINKIYSHGITGIGWVSASIPAVLAYYTTPVIKPYTRIYLKPQDFIQWIKHGLKPGALGVIGVKIIADGSLGARTAYLTKPYNDDPKTRGVLSIEPSKLEKIVGEAKKKKYHTTIHAIGDAALDIILDIYEKHRLLNERIDHASIVREDQVKKLKKLETRIAIQPGFILSDTWILDRIGKDRIKHVYRIKSLYTNNIVIGFSSDAPVEPPNPWRDIYAAVTRGGKENPVLAENTRQEKIDIETALHLHTRGSSKTIYAKARGCLEPGCYADYIVVDRNPLEIDDPEELLSIKILETRINGLLVWKKQ